MRSFCLLISMELILVSNSTLLYLNSNDINSFKKCFLVGGGGGVIAINIIVVKENPQIMLVCNLL